MQVRIEVSEAITTTDNIVHFVLTEDSVYEDEPSVARTMLEDEPFTLTSPGQSMIILRTFEINPFWPGDVNPDNFRYIVFVQTHSGNKEVLQAAQAVENGGLEAMIITGPGEGLNNATHVHGYDPDATTSPLLAINAYGVDKFGVNVATGDLDGDLWDDILTGPGPGRVFGPQVRAFALTGSQLPGVNFFAFGTRKYGVNISAGDIDGDGYDEILAGAGPGAVFGPHVRAFNYDGTGSVTPIGGVSFMAYGTRKFGSNVSCGNIDGDGFDEILTGAGPGAVFGPHVRGWNFDDTGLSPCTGVSYFAYGTRKWGVNVACGEINGTVEDEILTGAGPGAVFGPHFRAWTYNGAFVNPVGAVNRFAFSGMDLHYGVNVGGGDVDGDGMDEILAGAGSDPGAGAFVEVYNYDGGTLTRVIDFEAYPSQTLTHGTNVAVWENRN